MSRSTVWALALLLAGVGLLVYAAARGELRVGLFLIVPFVHGTGLAAFLGMLLVMAGIVVGALSRMPRAGAMEEPTDAPRGETRRTRSGGVVLLGPIPIVWGSDRRVLLWMIAAGAALLVLALVLTWRLR